MTGRPDATESPDSPNAPGDAGAAASSPRADGPSGRDGGFPRGRAWKLWAPIAVVALVIAAILGVRAFRAQDDRMSGGDPTAEDLRDELPDQLAAGWVPEACRIGVEGVAGVDPVPGPLPAATCLLFPGRADDVLVTMWTGSAVSDALEEAEDDGVVRGIGGADGHDLYYMERSGRIYDEVEGDRVLRFGPIAEGGDPEEFARAHGLL